MGDKKFAGTEISPWERKELKHDKKKLKKTRSDKNGPC